MAAAVQSGEADERVGGVGVRCAAGWSTKSFTPGQVQLAGKLPRIRAEKSRADHPEPPSSGVAKRRQAPPSATKERNLAPTLQFAGSKNVTL